MNSNKYQITDLGFVAEEEELQITLSHTPKESQVEVLEVDFQLLIACPNKSIFALLYFGGKITLLSIIRELILLIN